LTKLKLKKQTLTDLSAGRDAKGGASVTSLYVEYRPDLSLGLASIQRATQPQPPSA
jgi:hypothetical protein